ncbi:3-ketosteroid-9-alpha-hydroxylase [Pandoraea terrae]|uniref:3-ketosteroid-9-alpha-hydroxylase n=1 Tax=Pandoraea terrae TaxID=1537710 RepID=A0A5E4YW76_9BURK|nr:ferredoxin--NADP reductase [Pandoraea terrae]VVE52698.1 3-ketosteroid-9-alpha-hydroxylase [Pandoraea terrae]
MTTGNARYHVLRVRDVVEETADAKSLVFDVPQDLADTFHYRPGQFLTLRLPVEGRHVPRCYSMSSAPSLDAAPRVTIKRVNGGRGSNWVCDRVRPGDTLEVMAPAGVFTPRSLEGDFLLFAGGSGVTPVFSILRSVLANAAGRVCLIYANRDERSVIFRDTLRALAAEHPGRLTVIHWLDSVQGVPTVAQLAALARPWRDAQAFICGPAAFMDGAVAALEAVDMAPERVHVERFMSLPDEETLAELPADTTPAAVAEASIEVTLDGSVTTIACSGDETLLAAMRRAGLNPPASCEAGMCASCMCQVTDGEVHLRHNDVLDNNDIARGWTLGCQAVPMSAQVRIKFPE